LLRTFVFPVGVQNLLFADALLLGTVNFPIESKPYWKKDVFAESTIYAHARNVAVMAPHWDFHNPNLPN